MSNTATAIQSEGHVLMPPVIQFLQSSPQKLLIGGKWIPARSRRTFYVEIGRREGARLANRLVTASNLDRRGSPSSNERTRERDRHGR